MKIKAKYSTLTKAIPCCPWVYAFRLALSRVLAAQHTPREARYCSHTGVKCLQNRVNDKQLKWAVFSSPSCVTLSQAW